MNNFQECVSFFSELNRSSEARSTSRWRGRRIRVPDARRFCTSAESSETKVPPTLRFFDHRRGSIEVSRSTGPRIGHAEEGQGRGGGAGGLRKRRTVFAVSL